jgi:Major Facilitator Superfamily
MSETQKTTDPADCPEHLHRVIIGFTGALCSGILAWHMLMGNFLSLFVRSLDFSPILIGMLFQVIQIPAFLQIFAASYFDRHGCKKALCWVFFLSPILLLPHILAPQLGEWLGRWALIVGVFTGLSAFSLVNKWAGVGWLPLMRRNLPEGRRAGIMGHINAYAMFTAVAVLLAFSTIITDETPIPRYQLIFSLVALGAMSRALFLLRMKDVEPDPTARGGDLRRNLAEAWSNIPFRRLIIFMAIIFFGVGITIPFRPLYLKAMGFGDRAAFLCTVPVGLLAYGLATRSWGRLVDRRGSRAAYGIAGTGTACFFLLMLIPGGEPTILQGILFCLFMGASIAIWGGVDSANIYRLFNIVPRKNQSLYMSIYALAMVGALSLGNLASGLIVELSRVFSKIEGDATVWECKLLYLVGAGVLLLATLYSRSMRELHEMSSPRLLMHLRLRTARRLAHGWGSTYVRFRGKRPNGRKGTPEIG